MTSPRANSNTPDRPPLAGEVGTIRKRAPNLVALGYPAPYDVAVSSLGFQTVYRSLNAPPGLCCERFFLDSRGPLTAPPQTAESRTPITAAQAIAFSVACETELLGVIRLLRAAGLAPRREERHPKDPAVLIGGPLTLVDPQLVAPLADVVVVGEAEPALPRLAGALADGLDRRSLVAELRDADGVWAPASGDPPPPPARAPLELLPARAATWSPNAELSNLYLVEAARGCRHGCAFCVLSSRCDGARRFRAVPPARIIDRIPADAPGVGLVGAAVTDHPEIETLVERIVASGRRVSLSSIRAERLTPGLATALRAGGLRTLTLAADGPSERLRSRLHKGLTAADLIRAAETAAAAGIKRLKLYAMLGLPDELADDVDELAELVDGFDRRLRVSIAAQAFVPKPGTPLAATAMAPRKQVRRRLRRLARRLAGRARVIPTSPRWSWVDWRLAHAGERAVAIALDAERDGGGFAAWRQAIDRHAKGTR